MAHGRAWTQVEDKCLERNILHKGVRAALRSLHRAGFKDRTVGAVIRRYRVLGLSPGESDEFIHVIDIDPGRGRAKTKRRFTRLGVLTEAERDGVLRRVPCAAGNRSIPYVPVAWADAYIERVSKASNGEEVARDHVRRSWLPTKVIAELFGMSIRSIEKHIPATLGEREQRHQPYQRSVRPYLDAIPKQRLGWGVYWEPGLTEVNAAAYKRTLPPIR